MTVDVEVLTRDHQKAVHTDEGIVIHTVPSLFAQLRDAIYSGMGSDGSGGPGRPKLPLHAAALDLYNLLDRQVSEVWVEVFGRVPNADRVEVLLAQWGAFVDPETLVVVDGRQVYARDAVSGWVRAIEDYLNPPRLAEITAPCPGCGDRYVFRFVDGERVRSAALSFRRDRETGETLDASCAGCGRSWVPSHFRFLAEQIGASLKAAEEGDAS